MLNVYHSGEYVASISLQSALADNHVAETPWLLLYKRGRIDRFESQKAARAEALKTWGRVKFSRK